MKISGHMSTSPVRLVDPASTAWSAHPGAWYASHGPAHHAFHVLCCLCGDPPVPILFIVIAAMTIVGVSYHFRDEHGQSVPEILWLLLGVVLVVAVVAATRGVARIRNKMTGASGT